MQEPTWYALLSIMRICILVMHFCILHYMAVRYVTLHCIAYILRALERTTPAHLLTVLLSTFGYKLLKPNLEPQTLVYPLALTAWLFFWKGNEKQTAKRKTTKRNILDLTTRILITLESLFESGQQTSSETQRSQHFFVKG